MNRLSYFWPTFALALMVGTTASADAPVDAPGQTKPPVTAQPPAEGSDNPAANPLEAPVNPSNTPNQSLSKQLDEGEGVITPPAGIDPEIKLPPPKDFDSNMPVIKPPGETGTDQVQPK